MSNVEMLDSGGASALTLFVLDGLRRLIELYQTKPEELERDLPDSETNRLLRCLPAAVASLTEMAKRMKDHAAELEELNQATSMDLQRTIADVRKHEEEIASVISDCQAALEKEEVILGHEWEALQALNNQVDSLNDQIRQIRWRYDVARAALCWNPFAFLLTGLVQEIDQRIGVLSNRTRELQWQLGKKAETEHELYVLRERLNESQRKQEEERTQEGALKDAQQQLEDRLTACAARVACAMELTRVYTGMHDDLLGLARNLERVQRVANIARRLEERVDYCDQEGKTVTTPLREALLALAGDYDRANPPAPLPVLQPCRPDLS